ncbi:MAG: 50S ribosomal protein L17 [Coriobacteriia bacterium]|nr:50S ribosomal protein L17 [Coriobacteriia bacterium]
MRHLKSGRKLGTDASHTKAILRGLTIALLTSERIKTTEPRAKEVRSMVERVITWGRRGDVHSRRLIIAELGGDPTVEPPSGEPVELSHRVIAQLAPRFEGREGGYTRILKLGPRKGDAAPVVILELVD